MTAEGRASGPVPPARVVGRIEDAAAGRLLGRFARCLGREELRATWVERAGRAGLELRRWRRAPDGTWAPTSEAFMFTPAEIGGLAGALAEALGLARSARADGRRHREQP